MSKYTERTKAREYSFKFFYQLDKSLLDSNTLPSLEALSNMISEYDVLYFEADIEHPDNTLSPKAKNFGVTIINGVVGNIEALKEEIGQNLKKKSLSSLDKVCLPILLMGAFEILFYRKTPKVVVINDCLNIAKKYGTQEIASFINGVLDKIKATA